MKYLYSLMIIGVILSIGCLAYAIWYNDSQVFFSGFAVAITTGTLFLVVKRPSKSIWLYVASVVVIGFLAWGVMYVAKAETDRRAEQCRINPHSYTTQAHMLYGRTVSIDTAYLCDVLGDEVRGVFR